MQALRLRIPITTLLMASLLGTGGLRAESPGPVRQMMDFEKNVGQFDPSVRFVSKTRDYALFLTDTEAVVALRDRVLRLSFDRAQPGKIVGEERRAGQALNQRFDFGGVRCGP